MAVNTTFNKIIDLIFLDKNGFPLRSIICPRHGQKPAVEINGTILASSTLSPFNITVKNLYLNINEQYAKIKINAGYEGNFTTIEASILSMFQESPGPEGNTVIQCEYGVLDSWLNTYVDLKIDKGMPLVSVLEQISSKLGLDGVKPSPATSGLTLNDTFQYQGKASGACNALRNLFPEQKLIIIQRDNRLCSFSLTKGEFVGIKKLKYLSSPPQKNSGDTKNVYYTTFTAPWMPDLECGYKLIIPAWQYMKNFNVVNSETKTNIICVTNIQFQFSTVGNANNMTVQGYGI